MKQYEELSRLKQEKEVELENIEERLDNLRSFAEQSGSFGDFIWSYFSWNCAKILLIYTVLTQSIMSIFSAYGQILFASQVVMSGIIVFPWVVRCC